MQNARIAGVFVPAAGLPVAGCGTAAGGSVLVVALHPLAQLRHLRFDDGCVVRIGPFAEILLEILERHMQEENERTCAVLEEHFTDEEREALGRRFTAAKARLNMKLKAA